MKKVKAKDKYELPLNESDTVYDCMDDLVNDIAMIIPFYDFDPTYEQQIYRHFEECKEKWYIRSKNEIEYIEITPSEINNKTKIKDFADKLAYRIRLL